MNRYFLCGLYSFLIFQNTQLKALSLTSLPKPYCSLEKVLPFDNHGWYINSKQISKCIKTHGQVQTAVEIGSWLGKSTRHIASLLPKNAKLYAVDWWFGCPECEPGGIAYNPEIYAKHKNCYEQFLSNTIHAELTDIIIPVRMESGEAAKVLEFCFDFIYLDATHATESVYRDLMLWYPKLKENGIFCGDDWLWESVRIAVNKFALENTLVVRSEGNFWQFLPK